MSLATPWPILDGAVWPDGEHLILGWRSIGVDFRSVHDPSFRWPYPGQWTPEVDADDSGADCGRGLHVALNWRGASAVGSVHAGLVVGFRPEDVAHWGTDKVRVRRAWVANVVDLHRLARDGHLSGANLYGANLSRANLSGANLSRANLYGANLSRANLSGANLSRANLYGANLSRADLYGANLYGANLYGANLYGANLSRADLYGANLSGANLSRADLYGANLSGANLSGAIGVER